MTIQTVDWLAREALLILQSNMVATQLYDRMYEADFSGTEARGDTIRVRRRDRGNAQEFTGTIVSRPLEESTIDIVLEKHYDASFEITSKEATLDLDSFSEQVIEPEVISIAELVDTFALSKINDLPNNAGVDGAGAPIAFATDIGGVAQYRKVLNELKTPMAGRQAIWSPTGDANLLSIASFVEANKKGDDGTALAEASLGRVLGFDHWMAQNVDETALVSQDGDTAVVEGGGNPLPVGTKAIPVDAANGAAVVFADKSTITLDGINYTVNGDATMSGSAGTINILEGLKTEVLDNAALTTPYAVSDSFFPRGAMFHPRAFAFVSVPLEIPPGAEGAMIAANGYAIRIVRDYDILTKKSIISLDTLVGCRVVHGELGAKVVTDA
jgi:hypothetical protein